MSSRGAVDAIDSTEAAARIGPHVRETPLVRSRTLSEATRATVLLKLDNRPVKNENHCINLIADLLPGQRVKVEFWRNRQAFVVEAPVGDWSQGQARLKTGQ